VNRGTSERQARAEWLDGDHDCAKNDAKMPPRTPNRRDRTTSRLSRQPASPAEGAPQADANATGDSSSTEAQADIILETSPLGIVVIDAAGQIVRTNGRLEQMFGYQRGELIGRFLDILLPERLRAIHGRHRDTFFADPHVRPMGLGLDLVGRHKSGREFPVEISLSYLKVSDQMLALGFVSDITPRRNDERRLQAEFAVTRVFSESRGSEELIPRLIQALCESLEWDLGEFWRLDGDILRHQAGWHRAELDTKEFDALARAMILSRGMGLAGKAWELDHAVWVRRNLFIPPRTAAAAQLALASGAAVPVRGKNTFIGVMVLLSGDMREPDEASLAMLTDIGRRIGQHLDHQRVEMELRHQREVLYQSEKLTALGRLVAGVAHEMNNPLGIISSRIELMLAEADGQNFPIQHLEDLKVVHRNVLRVAGVAQALRSFARQSTGEPRAVNLNTVVEETLLLVGKPMSTDNIRITTALDPALPALRGDANALQQVLLNLVTNAREAMAGGRGEIRIETGPDPEQPGRLRLAVVDTGPGIAPGDLLHIFEPFYTTKPSGTGLGLAVSYGIVQDHLGTIDVDSAPGRGATFTIRLPILDSLAGSG
jgi:two-component system, cell cycle sensor histidine kinase and response regulator CckA